MFPFVGSTFGAVMTKDIYELPPRITEGTLSDLQSKLGHSAFKRSNAKAAVIRAEAQLTTDKAALKTADTIHEVLEGRYQEATTRFHEQAAQAAGDLPKPGVGQADVHHSTITPAPGLSAGERRVAEGQMDGAQLVKVEKGDKVREITSGREMEVHEVNPNGSVDCKWTTPGGTPLVANFQPAALELISRRMHLQD